ncbi:MAG: SDR family oxidoreductase [Cyanobacteria bacterium J06638_28]
MRSLLVTGASGFLGWHTCRLLASDWQVWGTHNTQPLAMDWGTVHPLDLRSEISIQQCWETVKPDAVLHTAAISKVNQCQQDPEGSWPINVDASVKLARRCAASGIPFLFTSTDLVFDGTQAPYCETDVPSPINHYGQQKASAEAAIQAVYPQATICRLPLLYGAKAPTAGCFLQGFLAAIAAGKTLTLFTDEVRTPAEVTDVVGGLNLVLQQRLTGIVHLGGPQRLNRYELGRLIATAFDLPASAMQPCLQSSVALPAPRPKDVSLNSQKALALGFTPRTVEAALPAIAQAHH